MRERSIDSSLANPLAVERKLETYEFLLWIVRLLRQGRLYVCSIRAQLRLFTHPSRAPLDDHHSWHADESRGLHTLAVAGPIDGMFGIFSVDITH